MEHRIPVWVWLIAIGICGVIFFAGRRAHLLHYSTTHQQTNVSSSPSSGNEPIHATAPTEEHNSLHIDIPNPPAPAHNAYDDFLLACKVLIDESGVARAYADTNNTTITLTEKETLLRKNARARTLLQTGLAHNYQCPPIRSFAQAMPYAAHFRGLMHLLMLDSQVQAAHARWDIAVPDALQAIQLGTKIQHGTILIGYLEGISFQMTGARACWSLINQLDLPQTMTDLQSLQSTLSDQTTVAEAIREEKWMALATIKAMLEQSGKTETDHSLDAQAIKQLPEDRKRQLIAAYTQYLDAWIDNASKPYAAFVDVPPPSDPYVRQFAAPNMWKLYLLKAAACQANLRMLQLTLALQAYHLQHHTLPPTLDALTPAYLRMLPNDPFARQGSFLYRPKGSNYRLYSLGPDGKDDGGEAVDNGGDINTRYRISEDSQGDLVAGINM